MLNIIISIIIFAIAISIFAAYKRYQDKKMNKVINFPKQEDSETPDEATKLDIYNAIIGLSNQMTLNNLLLFLILIIIFIKLILPTILAAIGIGYVTNELNNLF